MSLIDDLRSAEVGDYVRFAEEKHKYEIQARDERYLVCNKPFNLQRTVFYTIIDLEEQIRGPENLLFGIGAETREQCEDMLQRLKGKDADLGFTTEVSHRNRVPLIIKDIIKRKS